MLSDEQQIDIGKALASFINFKLIDIKLEERADGILLSFKLDDNGKLVEEYMYGEWAGNEYKWIFPRKMVAN